MGQPLVNSVRLTLNMSLWVCVNERMMWTLFVTTTFYMSSQQSQHSLYEFLHQVLNSSI